MEAGATLGARPMFRTLLKTLMLLPATTVAGAATFGTTRSGGTTVIGVAVASALLVSSCSVTWSRPSATASTK